MRDEDEGGAEIAMERQEQTHDMLPCGRIQVACWLVR